MRVLTIAFSSVLAAGCASDDEAAPCPEPDEPVGAALHCHLVGYLHEAGFDDDQIVGDAATLLDASVLIRPGWSRESDAIFALGEPVLYLTGQRVVYSGDKVGLVTFAVNDADGAAFVGTIEVALDGTVLANGVKRLPR